MIHFQSLIEICYYIFHYTNDYIFGIHKIRIMVKLISYYQPRHHCFLKSTARNYNLFLFFQNEH